VYHSVWVGIDPSQSGEPVNFRVNFERTTYLVVGARINVDIDHNLGTWEEIDSVKLFGVSNYAPTNLTLSNSTIAENQAVGTAVGTLTTTDPDTDNTFTYSLVTGTGDTDNALFTVVGNQLQSNSIFDFETKNSYSIRVKTTDQGGLSYEKALTININDVQPTITLAVSPNAVSEDGSTNLLYTLTRDSDLGNSLTVNYAIAGTATNGTDYTSIGTSVTFTANSNTAIVTVDPIADAFVETDETVILTLATGTGYAIGTTTAVTGTITNDDNYTTIESVGNTSLIKDGDNQLLSQVGSNTAIALNRNGIQLYEGYSGWSFLAAETVNSSNQVLVKNSSWGVRIWSFDSNWDWTSAKGVATAQVPAQEAVFGVDADGDGTIGFPDTIVESAGNTTLIKAGDNKLFTQVGSDTLITLNRNGIQLYEGYSGWSFLAAETVNGSNQVLVKNSSWGVRIWGFDSNWNWTSVKAVATAQVPVQETVFGVDADGNGIIGNPNSLNLTGTSGNDTLIGGANSDILTGLGGKDGLTGGLESDRFVYQTLTDSLLANYDEITDFNAVDDLFLVSTARTGFSDAGVIETLDNAGISANLTNANFGANSAASFTFGSRSFVAINDAMAGFQEADDAIIEVTGFTGTLGLGNFVIA
jgi:hypothetical protein